MLEGSNRNLRGALDIMFVAGAMNDLRIDLLSEAGVRFGSRGVFHGRFSTSDAFASFVSITIIYWFSHVSRC